MDFRDLAGIKSFMNHIETKFGSLDILINNAAQTVRRPTHFYRHLLQNEMTPFESIPSDIQNILLCNSDYQKSVLKIQVWYIFTDAVLLSIN